MTNSKRRMGRVVALSAAIVVAALQRQVARAANTASVFNDATDLSNGNNYTPSIADPTAAQDIDVQFSGTYSSTTFDVNGAGLNFGTLNDLDATQSLVISNALGTAGSITLNTPANSTTGSAATDLLYVAGGANLSLQNGTGGLTLNLAAAGNIDNAGTLSIAVPITLAAGKTFTFTGAGITTVGGNIASSTAGVTVNAVGGNVILSGSNAYTGLTTLQGGTLTLSGSSTTSGVTINGGTGTTLVVTSASALGSGPINIATGVTTPTIKFHINGGGTISLPNELAGNSGIVTTFDVNNNGDSSAGGVIQLNGTTVPNIGNDTYNITGGNGYSLYIASLADSAGAAGTVKFNPTTASLSLGTLTIATANKQNATWNFDGTNAANFVVGAISDGSAGGISSVSKTNSSTWTFQGVSTYTGATSITGGTLALTASGSTGAGLGNTAVTVGSGATLAVTPGPSAAAGGNALGGSLTLNAGANFTMNDGVASQFTVAGDSTLAPATGAAPLLSLEIGNSSNDSLAFSGAATLGAAGDALLITTLPGMTAPANSYTLITAASGLDGGPVALVNNRLTVNGQTYIMAIASSPTAVVLNTAAENTLYWTGLGGTTWGATNGSSTNWSPSSTGTPDAQSQPNLGSDVYFTASSVPSSPPLSLTLGADVSIDSLNFTAASPAVTFGADGHTLTLNGLAGINVASGAAAQTLSANLALNVNQTWTNASGNLLTIGPVNNKGFTLTTAGSGNFAFGGVISGTGGIATAGTGVVTLSAANTYAGDTLLSTGTLVFATDQALAGNLVFGLPPSPATNATSVATTTASLDLTNANANFAGTLVVQTNNSLSPNTIIIGAGKTLTLQNGLTMGLNVAPALGNTVSALTISGAGALSVTGGNVQVGVSQSTSNSTNTSEGVLNLGELTGGFTANVTNFNVGVGNTTGGIVTLSAGSNSITATTLTVGNSTANNAGPTQLLTLGPGTNTFAANTLNIALSKSSGTIAFASQATDSPGTLTITSSTGGDATIDIADRNGTGGTTSTPVGLLNLDGHVANISAGNVTIGRDSSDASTANITGSLNFGGGTFNIDTSLTLAALSVSSGATKATGTLNVDGGAVNINTGANVLVGAKSGSGTGTATAVINVNAGALNLASGSTFTLASASGSGTSSGTLNIKGGAVTSNVDLLSGGGTAALNLTGGTLDMTGHAIGAASPAVSVNFASGTLQNVGSVNGGAGVNKTQPGNLVLAGNNTYSGLTAVSSGQLTVTLTGANTGNTVLANTSGLSVGANAQFNYLPPTPGSDAAPNTLNLGTSGTINLSAASIIGLAFGDAINAPGAATAPAGTVYLDLLGTFNSGSTYTLLTASSGDLTNGGGTTYSVINPTNYTGSVVALPGSVKITPTAATPLTTAYWSGNFSTNPGVWAASDGTANSNWVTNSDGSGPTPLVPGSGTSVIFSATGATNQGTMTLGADMSVAGITVNDTATLGLTDPNGHTLTVGSGGITVNAGAGATTLASQLALASAQSWTNNSASTLTISGRVNNQGNLLTLAGHTTSTTLTLFTLSGVISGSGGLTVTADTGNTIANAPTINITGLNTYTGPTTVNAAVAGKFVYLSFNSLGNVNGGASALGNPDSIADGTITLNAASGNRATLSYTGGNTSSDRVLNATGAGSIQFYDKGGVTVTLTGGITNTSGTPSGMSFRGGGTFIESGVVAVGATPFGITDNTTLHLTNPNSTFTGDLSDHFGTIFASSISNIGTPSSIGEGSASASSIQLAQNSSTGTLVYNGATDAQTNRAVQILNNGTSTATKGVIQNATPGTVLTLSGKVATSSDTSTNPANFTVGGAGNGVLAGGIGDAKASKLNFTMSGTGTWALNGVGNYGGATTVSSGTLLANSTDTTHGATGSGLVSVASGATLAGGTAAGAGQILGTGVSVAARGILSAGDGALTPGKLNITGTTTLVEGDGSTGANGGSAYAWKIASATGTAGSDWDQLSLATLALTSSANGNVVTVEPISVGGGSLNAPVANFNPNSNYTWPIALVSGGGLSPSAGLAANFQLDAPTLSTFAAANNASPSSFALDVSNNGAELDLVYISPAPEPTSLALLGIGAGALLLRRRRKQ